MSTVPGKYEPPAGLSPGEPVWEIARLYPAQGSWTEREYLDLNTNHLVEFSHGYVEFLPMPTLSHQLIAYFLHRLLESFVSRHVLGTVIGAGYKVRLWEDKYRVPDVVFVRSEHSSRMSEEFTDGADLVMEIVSRGDSDRNRDLVTKRTEYARASIPEYWIVDPAEGRITVLAARGYRIRRARDLRPRRSGDVAAVARLRRGRDRRPGRQEMIGRAVSPAGRRLRVAASVPATLVIPANAPPRRGRFPSRS